MEEKKMKYFSSCLQTQTFRKIYLISLSDFVLYVYSKEIDDLSDNGIWNEYYDCAEHESRVWSRLTNTSRGSVALHNQSSES